MSEFFGFAATLQAGETIKDCLETANQELLEQAVITRNLRKAKSILLTCVEFMLAVFILWQTVSIEKEGNINGHTKALGVFSVVYAFLIGLGTFLHAKCFASRRRRQRRPVSLTTKEIEQAYGKTNNLPLMDGFLEIPLVIRFGGWPGALVALGAWTIFFAILVHLVVQIKMFREPPGTVSSASLGIIQLYRISADVCEYYVYARHCHGDGNQVDDDKDNSNMVEVDPTTTSDDDADMEMGKRIRIVENDQSENPQTVSNKIRIAKQALEKATWILESGHESLSD